MIPAWTDEDLACLARDYRNHLDVADLIAGVRRVLALHSPRTEVMSGSSDPKHVPMTRQVCAHCGPLAYPCATVRALNDPNGATP